jgi:hypothetical protein
MGWNVTEPGVLHVVFTDADHARLATNVLRDSVDGARLALRLERKHWYKPASEYDRYAWFNRNSNLIRAVNALPGVVGSNTLHGNSVLFYTDTRATADRLRNLVRETLPNGTTTSFAVSPGNGPDSSGSVS